MYRVLSCLTDQHNPTLVVLAAFVCIVTAAITFWLLPSMLRRTGGRRLALLAVTAIALGGGTWSTHFIGILAYEGGVMLSYDLALTVASLMVACAVAAVGLIFLTSGRSTDAALAGAVIGIGISAMHFVGMEAVIAPGRLVWDSALVQAAVICAMAFGAASTLSYVRLRDTAWRFLAPVLLVLAICSLHFTAMAAVTVTADPTVSAPTNSIDKLMLTLLVVGVTTVMMLISIVTSILDRFTIARGMFGFGSAVLATLAAAVVIGAFAMEQMRIGGNNYNRIIAGKDLVADILPPPVFILEAYLETRFIADSPESFRAHKIRIEALKRDYASRLAHWRQSRDVTEVTRLLLESSDQQVQLFWQEVETKLFPAAQAGDRATVLSSFDRLTANFLWHRYYVEQAVTFANENGVALEQAAEFRNATLQPLAGGAIVMLLLVVGGALWVVRSLVVRPVLAMSDYLATLSSGRTDVEVPFATRTDEIGQMGQAIDSLRLASIDKQRLEEEATQSRRRRDEARAQRERERVAEAMRLNMANENVSQLNNELNGAIEKLKRAQDEMVRKGRLAQMGQLTATMAHEIRNPLGAIKTAVYVIERKTKDKELAIEQPLQRVHKGIQRCDAIITELLDFTRVRTLALTAQSADQWMRSIVEEERRTIAAEVDIVTDFGAGDAPVQFDASRMRRVVVNLLSNAAEAMVGSATNSSTPAERTVDPRITVATRSVDGNIRIVVTDNGPGISAENLQRIREPLFTTKSFGVGLGLPAVESILEQHGGGLDIVSEVGSGATMTAWFPAIAEDVTDTDRRVA